MNHRSKNAFTLVELLVVIAIVALLLALLLPALGRAKTEAMLVKCAANQKQLALAAVSYAAENRAFLPPTLGKDIINAYYGQWTTPTAIQINADSSDPVTLAFSNGGKMYRLMGSYLPNVNTFFCPLDAPKPDNAQATYIASNVSSQHGSYVLMWNWNGGGTAFVAKSKLEDNNAGLLTADMLFYWTGAAWYPPTFWRNSHPFDGGVATAPANSGSSWFALNASPAMPRNMPNPNASYVDGRVVRFKVQDSSYVLMGGVPQVQLYLPNVRN